MSAATHELTIEAVANRVGMSVRNIRAYQSRGLVPPPLLRGRTGYYGEEHVERLEMIRELQAEGFRLEAIERFVRDGAEKREEILGLTRAARQSFTDEEPREVSAEELAADWGADAGVLERAVALGLLRPLDSGRYEARSPRLGAAIARLTSSGIDPLAALELFARTHEHAAQIAEGYVELFLEQIWRPFEAAGRPDERLAEVRQTLENLRPAAGESLLALFGLALSEATARTLDEEIEKIDERH